MFPYFYQSASFSIGSYGVMLAIAYLVGRQIYLTNLKKANKSQINAELLLLCLLFFGLLGAKLMYLLKNPNKSAFTDWSSLISGTGFSSQGALLAALIVTITFSKLSKVKLHVLLDAAAPAAILAYAIARVGCFLSGDECWGKQSFAPWAMAFPHGIHPTPAGIKVHPVPLYEIFYSLMIWFYLNYLNRKPQPPFLLFFTMLLLWGACRFLVEFVSTNPIKIWAMTGSQFGALLMFIAAVVYFIWLKFYAAENNKQKSRTV